MVISVVLMSSSDAFPQNHCKRQPGAALVCPGVAVGSIDSVPAYAESGSTGQRLLPGSAEVAEDCFPHLAGNFQRPSLC